MPLVYKFGGSSVKDAPSMLQCASIIKNSPECSLVIVSATGKTTALIERSIDELKESPSSSSLQLIKENHRKIAFDLRNNESVKEDLEKLLNQLEDELKNSNSKKDDSKKQRDHLLSFGEKLSTLLFLEALHLTLGKKQEIHLINATELIITDNCHTQAHPHMDLIKNKVNQLVKPLLEKKNTLILTQGFIGSCDEGIITTLGKEGSDYTAALLANAIDACSLTIWTDVAGVATTDPRKAQNTYYIPQLSFNQASSLALAGAKVLFPKTIEPLVIKNIPCFVKKTSSPELQGTKICSEKDHCTHPQNLIALAIKTQNNSSEVSFLGNQVQDFQLDQKILHLFKEIDISIKERKSTPDLVTYKINHKPGTEKDWLNQIHHFYFVNKEKK